MCAEIAHSYISIRTLLRVVERSLSLCMLWLDMWQRRRRQSIDRFNVEDLSRRVCMYHSLTLTISTPVARDPHPRLNNQSDRPIPLPHHPADIGYEGKVKKKSCPSAYLINSHTRLNCISSL
ncbi:hypothetical protein SCLCIDRAFT_916959 [Scleroderma citrinum Foug A]|uniref:Uncharacterized protein n=1 Tax=Scleroderma citrinum Foug A TaxID=1036808 RepID=A0A0C3DYK7_9AGAM|nr:hypothetical protein SCLCIDRAFT_916959 [Scleroderma citrinum Foug A]